MGEFANMEKDKHPNCLICGRLYGFHTQDCMFATEMSPELEAEYAAWEDEENEPDLN